MKFRLNKKVRHLIPYRFLVVMLLIITVVALSGNGVIKAAPQPVTLTVWDWATVECPDAMNKIYREFEKTHPGVKISVDSLSFGDLINKQITAGKVGRLPDVMQIWAAGLQPEFSSLGYIADLGPYLSKESGGKEKFLKQYFPASLVYYRSKIYALPFWTNVMAVYVNETLLKEAGLSKAPTTWEEMVAFAKAANKPEKEQYGLALPGGDLELMPHVAPFVYQNGGRFGKVNGKYQVNSKATVEALGFVADLINKEKVVPAYTGNGWAATRQSFAIGKAAMQFDGSWGIQFVESAKPTYKWNIYKMPKHKTTGTVMFSGDGSYCMSTTTKNKKLAWELVKFMTSKASTFSLMSDVGHMSPIPDAYKDPRFKSNKWYNILQTYLAQAQEKNVINLYGELPYQVNDAIEIFKNEWHSYLLGRKSLQQAMDTVATAWTKLDVDWEKKYGK